MGYVKLQKDVIGLLWSSEERRNSHLGSPHQRWLSWQSWGEEKACSQLVSAVSRWPSIWPCLRESHETEESSTLSRSNLAKLARQRYSPAHLGTSFSVLHGDGKGSPYSPHTGGVCPTNSPRYPLSEGESQTGPFCFLDLSKKASSAGKKTLQLGYNSALNFSNWMTKICTISQSSHRKGDAQSSRNSVSFLPSYTHQENISPTSVLQCFYLPHPTCSSCSPNSSHFVRQNWKNKRLWEYLQGV